MLCRPAAVSRSSLGSLEQGLGVAARLKIDARNLTRRPGGRHRSAALRAPISLEAGSVLVCPHSFASLVPL